jgi:hypothetical protein
MALPRSGVDLYGEFSETASFEHPDKRGYGLLEPFGYAESKQQGIVPRWWTCVRLYHV